MLTINSGMAIKLYDQRSKDATLVMADDQNKFAQQGFSYVLITVTIVCILLSVISVVVSVPILRKCIQKKCCKYFFHCIRLDMLVKHTNK